MSSQKSTKRSVVITFTFIHTNLLIGTHVLESFRGHSKITFAQDSQVLTPFPPPLFALVRF